MNDLLGEGSGWDYLESANDINNSGQIIGLGYINGEKHVFLLNPVPPIEAEVEIWPKTLNLVLQRNMGSRIRGICADKTL